MEVMMATPLELSRRGKNNRVRGFGFEREIIKFLHAHGLQASRSWGSDGRSKGLKKEVDIVIQMPHSGTFFMQAKRSKKISPNYKPEDGIDFQVFRADNEETFVSMRLITMTDILMGLQYLLKKDT
jgi:hypothetical protein